LTAQDAGVTVSTSIAQITDTAIPIAVSRVVRWKIAVGLHAAAALRAFGPLSPSYVTGH